MDRIGLVVTYINDEGFIKAEPVGGIDLRTLQSSAVKVLGKETILGVICTMPPHLSKNDDELSKDKIWIDTGLSADKVKELVSLGDTVIVCSEFRELLNNQVAVSALYNRAGCAVLVKCAEHLKDKTLPCRSLYSPYPFITAFAVGNLSVDIAATSCSILFNTR